MKNEIKNYCRYFVFSNLKFIILETILLFVALPFPLFILKQEAFVVQNNQPMFYLERLSGTILLCSIIIAIVIPFIVYRFLNKRRSCDVYFALPIKRKQLFSLQYVLGLMMALIPFTLNIIIAIITFYVRIEGSLTNSIIPYIALIYVIFFAIYTLVTFILMKCNNLIDAVFVSMGVVMLPLILYTATQSFLSMQVSEIYVTSGGSFLEVFDIKTIFNYLSPAICANSDSKYLLEITAQDSFSLLPHIGYWFIIGSALLYFSRKAFIARKEEHSEQRTTSIVTYPLIIVFGIISLAIGTSKTDVWSMGMLSSIVIVFVIFVIVVFIWKRKIQLRIKDIAFFLLIYAVTISFTVAFQSTKGFGMIAEVPKSNEIKEVSIALNVDEYNGDINDNEFVKENDIDTYFLGSTNKFDNKEEIERIIELQEELLKIGKMNTNNFENYEGNYGSVSITYEMKDGKFLNRYYDVFNEEGQDVMADVYNVIYLRVWN